MIATIRLLALGSALILVTGEGSARRFRPPAVQDDVEEVMKLLREKVVDPAAIAKKVADIKKKHALVDLMDAIYKPTKRKGLGWNPGKKGPGDGIEKHLIDLGTKKELSKGELAKEKDLLLRAAYYNLAMVEIAKEFGPPKRARKGIVQWTTHNIQMQDGSRDAIAAVEANDPKALKKAMAKLGGGCNGCHTDFR